MSDAAATLFQAHPGDYQQLRSHWDVARNGEPRFVLLQGVLGAGKRAMAGKLCREVQADEGDALIWRATMHDEEEGMQSLMRLYAGLFQSLHRNPVMRGKVEMALNSQIPTQPKRVQGWYQAFIEGLKKGAPSSGNQEFQVILPRDNPLIGLIEIPAAISRRFPILLDIQNLHHVQSLGIFAFIEALLDESKNTQSNIMVVLSSTAAEGHTRLDGHALIDLERRSDDSIIPMTEWSAEETQAYLDSKDLQSDAASITRIAGGRPGFIAEVVDWLEAEERLTEDISTLQMSDLADTTPDEDELESDSEPKDGRKPVTAEDADRIAYVCALLGLAFPSGLAADMGGYDRDGLDDLLDATPKLYKELQFSKGLGTWIYQFQQALLRESILSRHTSDEDTQIAKRVGGFMERFLVPRGYPYLVKTMRLYAEAGELQRAHFLRSRALSTDPHHLWVMIHDLQAYFDGTAWPTPMRRTLYMNLLDRLVVQGNIEATEKLWNEAMAWATEQEDRPLQGWLLFAGSRLDHRRQDLYRARDRAVDALKMFTALEDKLKQGEIHCHLSNIELADGNPAAALEQVKQATEVAPIPPMQAHAEFIQGQVARRNKKLPQAIEHFKKSNEIAGKAGLGPTALEAGLALGETLLMSRQHDAAAQVLTQVSRIAASMKNQVRERSATALLAQALAGLKRWEEALKFATRSLELTRELNFKRLESIDLYNMGFFNMMLGNDSEAVSLFRESRTGADNRDAGFQKELLFNMGTALARSGDENGAQEAYEAVLEPAKVAKDWRKVMEANSWLAEQQIRGGDTSAAKALLQNAVAAADTGNLREERKGLRRKLEGLA